MIPVTPACTAYHRRVPACCVHEQHLVQFAFDSKSELKIFYPSSTGTLVPYQNKHLSQSDTCRGTGRLARVR